MQPLFIIFLQLGIGGVQRKIVDMVNFLYLYKPDLPIYIILRNRTKFDMGIEIKNKNVKIINYAGWLKKINIRFRFFFPIFVLAKVWQLKPQSVLAFLDFCSMPAILAKKVFFWRKIKVVLSEDHYASGVISVQRWSRFRHWLIKIFYPLADVIFTCSQANKKDLLISYKIPENKIKIIQNWTNFISFKNHKLLKLYDLIYVGRLEKTKNLDFLLKALYKLKKIRNLKLLILGEGEEKKNLKNLATKLGIKKNINFVDAKYNVASYLNKAKIFTYCSQPKVEGFPIAILEAMSMGIPVLTKKFAGAQEFLQNGKNCFLFKNEEEFIKKTKWLLNNPSIRKQIAVKAKQYVLKHHSLKNMFPYFKELDIMTKEF